MLGLSPARLLALGLLLGSGPAVAQPAAWLDGDPAAIWQRPPGFYQDGQSWYAIVHTRPGTSRVRLAGDFTGGAAGAIDLTRTPDGKFWWWKGSVRSLARPPRAGDRYGFVLTRPDGIETWTQDPAARRVESSDLNARSLVTVSTDYPWHDQRWSRPGWEYYQIYQLHPLRFSDRNTALTPLERITEELDGDGSDDYLNSLGVTAVQLLPVNEFAGDIGWGYNPSFFYAIESAYGTPDQLKRLVDTAHQNGVAVILDLVFNHGGSSDNILWQIAQDDISHGTYYDGDTVWGPMVNFDNDVARHFFVQNIVYLAREFHIDGFRFDFTRPIHNPDDGNIRLRGSGGGWHVPARGPREGESRRPPHPAGRGGAAQHLARDSRGRRRRLGRRPPRAVRRPVGRPVPRLAQAGADRRQSRRAARGVRQLRRQLAGCRRLCRIARRGRQHRRSDRQARARRQGLGDGAAGGCRHHPRPRHPDAVHGPGGG